MKKILTILIFALVPAMMFAWGEWNGSLDASASVIGVGGGIIVNQSTSPSGSYSSQASDNKTQNNIGLTKTLSTTFYFHAKADKGYVFTGWYNDQNGTNRKSEANYYSESLKATRLETSKTAGPYYAFFKQILKPAYEEVVLYLYDDGTLSTFPLSVTLNKTTALSITDNSNGLLSITQTGSPSGAEGQELQLNITNAASAVGQFTDGDNFTITLTPSNSSITNTNTYNPETVMIPVRIVKVATITFTPPVVGGSYTYLQDNGLGQTIAVDAVKTTTVKGDGNDKMFTLSVTNVEGGYRFRRWVIDYTTGSSEYVYDKVATHPIMSSATVTAEFVSTDYAQFIVLPDTAKHYAHMDDAFDAAKKLGKTVVSVYQPGYVTINTYSNGCAKSFKKVMSKSEWLLPRPASGTYTIPSGYTLLVPGLEKSSLTGDASTNGITKYLDYTYLIGKSGEGDYLEYQTSPQAICKLIVESGTTIEVNGNISVYSCLSAVKGYTGRPTGYGQIHLKPGSMIQVNDGAILHVMGYITADDLTQPSVIAKRGSKIYEAFQITDWRGGTGLAGGNVLNFQYFVTGVGTNSTLVDNEYGVFPVGQYYVQSIESMLEMEYGAVEYLTTAVDVSKPLPVTTEFINAKVANETLGLFALGENTKLRKYYDPVNDRLKLDLIGTSAGASAEMSYMYMEMSVDLSLATANVALDSRNYVLPINNNIDVSVANIQLDVPFRFAFMPGSSVYVDENSCLNIKNEIYLYDRELNVQPANEKKGYYDEGDYPLRQITYTTHHKKEPNVRMVKTMSSSNEIPDPNTQNRYYENLSDATFTIDGTLIMEGNGALYTTTYGSAITSGVTDASEEAQIHDFGANITSNGGGVMNFKSIGTRSTTNQISQASSQITWIDNIPVCNAWLRNADGTRSGGTDAKKGDTYMYIDGVWQKPEADLRNPQGNTFTITFPEDKTQNVVCEVVEHNVTGTSFAYGSIEGTFEKAGDVLFVDGKLTIPVTYKKQNKHNKDAAANEGKIKGTLTYTDPLGYEKSKPVEIPLYGIEDYTPVFDVIVKEQKFSTSGTYANLIVGTGVNEDIPLPVVIAPQSGNVAFSLVQWIEAQNATTTPFVFNYGEDANKLSSAQLIYRPTQVGDHSGVLTITATYTDANSKQISSSIAITLNAKVDYKPNTLKFATFPNEIYFEDYNGENPQEPFLMIDAASNNAGTPISYSLSGDGNVIEILGDGTAVNPYTIKPRGKGTTTIIVEQPASDGVRSTRIEKSVTIKSRYDQLPELTFCVDEKADFDAVNMSADKVSYNTSSNIIDFAPAATWQFQFKGIPHQLIFTPAGDNAWRVMERASVADEWTAVVQWTNSFVSAQQQVLTLKPTTRQIQIQYGAQTENAGSISGLCVSKLELAADMSKLYLPVYYNTSDEVSTKNIVLTHIEATAPAITLASPLTYTATPSNNLGTAEEPYYTTTIAITAAHTTPEGTYAFTATQGTNTVSVAVRTYNFPQELPIKWAEDDAERYYFETVDSRFAQWNENNKELLFLNPGTQQKRSVTLAFNGAPSIIKFDLSEDIVDQDWTIEESVDGQSFGVNPSGRDSQDGNTLTHELNYTTRYVRVSYNSSLTNEVTLSNLVIEGYPKAIVSPESMFFTTDTKQQHFYMIAINLQNVSFEIDNEASFNITTDTTFAGGWINPIIANEATHSTALGQNKVDTIFLGVRWNETTALDEGKLTIRNNADNSILAIVPLLGSDSYLVKDKADNTGIYTGIPDGTVDAEKNYTYNGNVYTDYKYRAVNLTNAFAEDGTALFDYLFIYGETTPSEDTDITLPMRGSADGSTNIGSNAVTPLIVYKKALNADSKYMGYQFVGQVANVNTAEKEIVGDVIVKDDAGTVYIDVKDKSIRAYMTGFCPFATTGSTKNQEGVFLFRGTHGVKLDVYLEDFHVLSRNKTENGNSFYGDKEGGETYSENYARGSGGVLVFENVDKQEELQYFQPFEVSIHTTGNNLLNSNHGCFFALQIGGVTAMKAYQVSSPIQVHMQTEEHSRKTKTTLNFDDLWPTAVNAANEITDSKRTNGFLALKKQANNAPSIDMGNEYTVVNFNGGRVKLQNSQIGSDTYKTTLAISYRAGFFGSDEAGIYLCYGIGTDAVDGTVNFNDGTVTIEPMWVSEAHKQYYLIDTENDIEVTQVRNGKTEYRTTCLRAPKNTYVRGGSICRVRACQHVTSKGGAPKDSKIGSLLGQYVYTLQGSDQLDADTKLVTKIDFPANIENLLDYYNTHNYTYGLNSVTPDANNKLYFWIPDGYGDVTAEQDKFLITWKACMTQIGAGIEGVAKGTVGGDIEINAEDEVKYFLYCKLDQNIHGVIRAQDDKGAYTYQAPIEVPAAAKQYFNGAEYTTWAPNLVGPDPQHQVLSGNNYTITDRVYYITTATADLWQTFTAPFDVANIYVVEAYSENELSNFGNRSEILVEQARHNADFAAFFGVAMAMGTDKSFKEIYDSYIKWAKIQDKENPELDWDGEGKYTLRSMQKLTPYFGNNWRDANFYLNENKGNWEFSNDLFGFESQWETLKQNDTTDGILLHQGHTYSLMFPYCPGCEFDFSERDYWDYWSGKFIIFESSAASQTINGSNFLDPANEENLYKAITLYGDDVAVVGNSTFAMMETNAENVYQYKDEYPAMAMECFKPISGTTSISPTTAFLYGEVPVNQQGMPAKKVTREGRIIYGESGDNNGDPNNGTTTGSHTPTVGGDNDMFITAIDGGINIAVAAPQNIYVVNATGHIIYSGYVTTDVNVMLPINGIYVVKGENEIQKIFF